MNINFFLSMFRGSGNGISSKRVVLVWFVLLFTYLIILNAHTGRHVSDSLQTMLDEALKLALIAVFGEPAIAALGRKKGSVTETTISDDKSQIKEKTETVK